MSSSTVGTPTPSRPPWAESTLTNVCCGEPGHLTFPTGHWPTSTRLRWIFHHPDDSSLVGDDLPEPRKMEVQMSGGDVVEIGEGMRGRRGDEDVAG